MKLNKLWAGALALMALASCGRDLEPSVNVPEPEAPQTKLVNIEITADRNQDDLRAIFELNDEGKPGNLLMSDKDLRVYIVVKGVNINPNASQLPVYTYQEKIFTKVPGQNKATYTGKIYLPVSPTATFNYQISATLLGEVGTEDDGAKTFMTVDKNRRDVLHLKTDNRLSGTVSSDGKQLDINIPYLTKWTDVVANGDLSSIHPVYLHFEPRGTVLRYRIANHTNKTKEVKSISFVTTAFGTLDALRVDFSSNPTNDGFPDFSSGIHNFEQNFTEGSNPTSISVPAKQGDIPGYSSWYYQYVMPIAGMLPEYTETSASLYLSDNTRLPRVLQTKQIIPHGSVKVTLHVKEAPSIESGFGNLDDAELGNSTTARPKMAIEYVSEYVVNNDESNPAFIDNQTNTNPNVGFFNFQKSLELFATPRTIVGGTQGKKYSLPTYEEACSIFPSRYGRASHEEYLIGGASGEPRQLMNLEETNIKIGDVTANYTSDFNIKSVTLTYALRFKSASNYNRTAYRYQYLGTNGRDLRMVVTCRYVGNDSTIDINKVSEDSFWQEDSKNYVTRVYPLYGYKDHTSRLKHAGLYLWERTQTTFSNGPNASCITTVVQPSYSAIWRDSKELKFPVRLWERD